MSILEFETVDFVTVGPLFCALVQCDPLEWGGDVDDMEHVYYLQESINGCIAYYESGQFAREYPEYADAFVVIAIVNMYPLGKEGMELVEVARPVVESIGLRLIFDPVFPDGWSEAVEKAVAAGLSPRETPFEP